MGWPTGLTKLRVGIYDYHFVVGVSTDLFVLSWHLVYGGHYCCLCETSINLEASEKRQSSKVYRE